MLFRYKAFGLQIESELEIPLFLSSIDGVDADVTILLGAVPRCLENCVELNTFSQANQKEYLLTVDKIGRFYVKDGTLITIEPVDTVDFDYLLPFLAGSSFGMLLYQRGFFVMHGSTIISGDNCIIITGVRGAGKSSVAAELVARGFPIINDDLSIINYSSSSGKLIVHPGFPYQKLWADSMRRLSIPFEDNKYKKILPQYEKYRVPISNKFFYRTFPLTHIFELVVLDSISSIETRKLSGFQKVQTIMRNNYAEALISSLNKSVEALENTMDLVNHLEVYQISRPADIYLANAIAEIVKAILE
ncbi:MAG: hypothetical protein CVU00_14480 [Bacteroidetes bacterium HGW-Bacteroidetes-17]|nr:MAG: hypothetical protein CVU00_14480 [Bacteroidetes bacterium HGW-Bacteroidetes-17]